MSRSAPGTVVVAVCGALAGCTLFPDGPVQSHDVDASTVDAPPRCWWPPTDFLFVVENSALIAPYESRLEENFRVGFPRLLGTMQGGFPRDTRFGVVTSDVECDGSGTLSDLHWRGIESYGDRPDANLGTTLAGLAMAGHDGCGVNRPLEAARRAVMDPQFRRTDARLVITIVSVNADQSALATRTFTDAAKLTTSDPSQIGLVIIGHRSARWDAALADFPNRTSFSDIDRPDWTDNVYLWACLL